MFLPQLAYDADLVIPTPTWVSYAPQARIHLARLSGGSPSGRCVNSSPVCSQQELQSKIKEFRFLQTMS